MSDQVDATEEILEGAADVAEGVVQMARGFSGLAVSGAFVVGAGLGGVAAYFFAQRKLETKYSEIAAEEIAGMRQHYNQKTVALENKVDKPKLEELVREQGYSSDDTAPPMAVEPPSAVVDRAQETAEAEEGDGKSETAAAEPPPQPKTRNIFPESKVEDEWDWHKERAKRSPMKPFVIHRDEKEEYEAYDSVTFTYYEEDDVLCNESDEVIAAPDRERMIGEANLEKFGHGSGDANIVYIRNSQFETDIEVIRSPNSYAEEVHGFEPSDDPSELKHSDRRRGRFDDE